MMMMELEIEATSRFDTVEQYQQRLVAETRIRYNMARQQIRYATVDCGHGITNNGEVINDVGRVVNTIDYFDEFFGPNKK